MYVIGGRGGLLTVLLGLFILGIIAGLKILYYLFAAALALVLLIIKGIIILHQHRKAKKAVTQQVIALQDPPMPVKSRVGPRDWTPR